MLAGEEGLYALQTKHLLLICLDISDCELQTMVFLPYNLSSLSLNLSDYVFKLVLGLSDGSSNFIPLHKLPG
jgi:hypothetical protein